MDAAMKGYTRVFKLTLKTKLRQILIPLVTVALFILSCFIRAVSVDRAIYASLIVFIPWLGYFIYQLINLRKERLELTVDTLTFYLNRKSYELRYDDKDAVIFLVPPDEPKLLQIKKRVENGKDDELQIALTTLEDYQDIIKWVKATLVLSKPPEDEERQEIKQEESFGRSEEERLEHLKKWTRINKYANIVGVIALIYIFVYPMPYQFVLLAAIIMQLGALALPQLSKGIIKLSMKELKTYPLLSMACLGPGLGLALRGLMDNELVSYKLFWIYFAVLVVVFAGLAITLAGSGRTKLSTIGYALFLAVVFSAGTVFYANQAFVNVPSKTFKALMISKKITKGKDTSYYFKLAFSPQFSKDSVYKVGPRTYERYKEKDSVNVIVFHGRLKMDFYWIR